MEIVAIIPARMGSSRFPGKPMASIDTMPMIGHVYYRTALSQKVSQTWIATCDQEIMDYAASIGANAVMTKDTHERCSDRTAEAMLKIEEKTGKKIDIVVMVQGDEPLVTPKMIDTSVDAILKNDKAGVACLMSKINDDGELKDPNKIKIVTDKNLKALYMSREPIPSHSRGVKSASYKQVCIIPFKRDYLLRFNSMDESPLEVAESIDLNRCLEHGDLVQMALTDDIAVSVDVPEDVLVAENALKTDIWYKKHYG